MTMLPDARPGPATVTRVQLPNGLTILVRENHSAPVVVLEGVLPVGAIHDPRPKRGLANFVASTLTRGSRRYDYATFNETVEAVGASLAISGDTHTTGISVSGLSEDFPLLLDVLADVLRYPTFPAEQCEIVRRQTLVFHQERSQDTQRMAHLRFNQARYGDHPYGAPVTGFSETLTTVELDDLAAFHAQHYSPQGLTLVISGAVHAKQVVEQIERHLGDWSGPPPDQSCPVPAGDPPTVRVVETIADKVQADLVMGFPAVARNHPDYYALRVANTILGQFGMMGRLGESVREEQGLAYYCYSSLQADHLGGAWVAAAGVNPHNVARAETSIRQEFHRLANEPVPDEELADSQAYMTGLIPLALETNDGVASTLLTMEQYALGLEYLHRYDDFIYAITAQDIMRVAQTYLAADHEIVAVAGPPEA